MCVDYSESSEQGKITKHSSIYLPPATNLVKLEGGQLYFKCVGMYAHGGQRKISSALLCLTSLRQPLRNLEAG